MTDIRTDNFLISNTIGISALVVSALALGFVLDNTFGGTGFRAVTDFYSASNPVDAYNVVCSNLTIGNETRSFSGDTQFFSSCGEPPDDCSAFVCTDENRCKLIKADGVQCHVSSDCPGYLTGEQCDPSTCSCFQLDIGGGGPNVIVEQGQGNINFTVGFRLRNFGNPAGSQGIFIQLPNQTVAEWTKLNYMWGASSVHTINLNIDKVTGVMTLSVIAEEDPSVNSITSYDISALLDEIPPDSFQFISVARSGQELIYDGLELSGQVTSPPTYPGTPTFVNYYFLNVTESDENIVFYSRLFLIPPYAGQENSKIEWAAGMNLGLANPFVLSDFFSEVILP